MSMYFFFKSVAFRTAIVVMFACSLLAIEPVQAAEMSSKEKRIADKKAKYKSKKAAAMSQPVYKKLQKAQKFIEEKKYSEALTELASIRSRKKRLSSYEAAQSWNVTAYVYYLQADNKQAINAYNKVLEKSELPAALTQSTLKTVSQLYFIEEDYKKALATIQKLIAILESPSADVYMLHGQAYYQLKNYNKALPQIKKAVALYREQGRTPKENWLLLLRVIYHEKNDFKNMRIVLENLLELYPKDRYLQSLAGVYSELGDTHKQLTMMESLYERGYKQTSGQIINLANLYLLHGTPYKAAKVLQEGIEKSKRVKLTERNYRLLSQAWYQAREDAKSIPPMREAASLSESGELYIRIAQAYMNLDEFDEAAKAIKQGLNKGGLKRNDTAELMLGMALFNQKKLKQASVYFELAQKDKRSEKTAGQWIAYVKEEIRRNDLLKAADL